MSRTPTSLSLVRRTSLASLAYTSYQRVHREPAVWEKLDQQERWLAVLDAIAAPPPGLPSWRGGRPAYEAYHASDPAMIAWEDLGATEQTAWNTVVFATRRALSPPIQPWEQASPAGRTHVLMERVLGWECFGSWEDYLRKYGAQEWGLGAGQWFTTPTHVAFCVYRWRSREYDSWNFEWRVFTPDHEDLFVFDPLHRPHDAWRVLGAICRSEEALFLEVAMRLVADASLQEDALLRVFEWGCLDGWWQPEEICRAAYEAVIAVTAQEENAQEDA